MHSKDKHILINVNNIKCICCYRIVVRESVCVKKQIIHKQCHFSVFVFYGINLFHIKRDIPIYFLDENGLLGLIHVVKNNIMVCSDDCSHANTYSIPFLFALCKRHTIFFYILVFFCNTKKTHKNHTLRIIFISLEYFHYYQIKIHNY